MALLKPRRAALQARIADTPNPQHSQDVAPAGSWTAFALGATAAVLMVFAACALNASHAYQLGIEHGEFRALVLAAASVGAAILAPMGFLVATRGRGFQTRAVALVLALACLLYTAASSLGTIAGAQDAGAARHAAAVEAHGDRRALIEDARRELAGLKGSKGDVLERRSELTALLAKLTTETVIATSNKARPNAQAGALAFYLRSAGWTVDDAAVATWLALAMVLILEAGAALSATVAAALYPTPRRRHGAAPAATLDSVTSTLSRPADGAPASNAEPPDAREKVTPRKRPGRPCIGDKPLTGAERQKRYREKSLAENGRLN
jgi:hypothetical protein